jgi:hypothetical protein
MTFSLKRQRYFFHYFLWWFLSLTVATYLGYLVLSVVLPPKIVLTSPKEASFQTTNQKVFLRGYVRRAYILKVNGEMVAFSQDGDFERTVSLQPGINLINLEAESRFGKKATASLKILKAKNALSQPLKF